MTFKNLASLSYLALFSVACSAPTLAPPVRPSVAYPIEVPVPRVKPKQRYQPVPRPYQARVERYSENVATRVEDLDESTAMTTVNRPIHEAEQRRIDAESDRLDPYQRVSNNTANSRKSARTPTPSIAAGESSSAIMSLILQAKLDMLAGRSEVAIDKLERGLRIQPQNPQLWNKLAEAHFHSKSYTQAIAMAKKSLRLNRRNDNDLRKRNWRLIAKANQKMGNMDAMKAAMRKIN
jgi:tetratricopeptide (TPR) repeat protein